MKKEIIKSRFAGTFYEKSKEKLLKQIKESIVNKFGPKKERLNINSEVVIVPHAGYAYSGPLMAYCYASMKKTDRIFIFATNHSGHGMKDLILIPPNVKAIKTPLGNVEIDIDVVKELKINLNEYIEENKEIIINEHSYEVQLPFIKYFFPEAKIIPLIVNTSEINKLNYFAKKIIKITKLLKGDTSFVFTSDFTHYGIMYGFMPYNVRGRELKEKIYLLDKECIDKIIALDTIGFEKEARKTTICGIAPIMLCIELSKLEKLSPLLLNYYTSSDITHDYDYISHAIVGYAGIAFRKIK